MNMPTLPTIPGPGQTPYKRWRRDWNRFLLALAFAPILCAADYRVGVARVEITPGEPIWMSGYANRSRPSEGVAHPLWAKALAIDDGKGGQAVLVTTDLIGLPRSITDVVAARVIGEHKLERSQVVFNSSHTHAGPVVRPNLSLMYSLTPEQGSAVRDYSVRLTDQLVALIGEALGDRKPSSLRFGSGAATFAMNRREPTPKGVKLGVNPQGPTDHAVPVLEVVGEDGRTRAVLFGYACHNTTLTGDSYRISPDYAGYSQADVEKARPGVTALFLALCGGDQNPDPRGTEELSRQHGASLAQAVLRVLEGQERRPVRGRLRTAFRTVELPFAPHTRSQYEQEAQDKNVYRARRAKAMLAAYDERRAQRSTPYPVQAIRFGGDLTLLALGGEVVVDYALRAKREFPRENLVVAGYSNDVMCYIPTARILREGGYEAVDSMTYYGMPGPFNDEVEERVFDSIRSVMRRVGAK